MPGISHYRKCIRSHIRDVLETTYASTCEQLSSQHKTRLVDSFIDYHSAKAPEFHHIATEILIFVIEKLWFSPSMIKVMEYEWLLLTIEINPAEVFKNTDIRHHCIFKNHNVIPNPTLSCIQLPFSLPIESHKKETPYETHPSIYYYMICRDHEHDIIYKELDKVDSAIIPTLSQSEGMTWKEIDLHYTPQFSEPELMKWLRKTHEMQFITISVQEAA
ncbi:putative DNA-binding domain-containing protein [Cobetia sp. L2A1]|uniref:putative DNA-binding domain-containing protein n=1 Tax=Cobetia sp. L2A1 TaxID=2686360 RepID=UPI00131D7CE3|nr:putative DNA-binding domain-containing protein [Cobetia sp. L2A1]